jgi:signal transduction histidine kinase
MKMKTEKPNTNVPHETPTKEILEKFKEIIKNIGELELGIRTLIHDMHNILSLCKFAFETIEEEQDNDAARRIILKPYNHFYDISAALRRISSIAAGKVELKAIPKEAEFNKVLQVRYEILQDIVNIKLPLINEFLQNLKQLVESVPRDKLKGDLGYLDKAAKAADTAGLLVEERCAMMRDQNTKSEYLRLVDVGELVKDLERDSQLKLFQRESGVILEISLPEEKVEIVTSPSELKSAVVNLLINADHASEEANPKDRSVKISVDTYEDSSKPHRKFVLLKVTDNGFGMTKEVKAKIFEPHFTTKGDKGSGIGLPSVQRYVQEQNGRIEVQSEPGKGSTFSIYLPLEKGAA